MALLRKYVEESGLVLECFVTGVANRVTCLALAEDNETARFALSVKEGDMHADLNERSRIRRFAQMHSSKQPKKEAPREVPGTPSTVDAARVMDAIDRLPRAIDPAPESVHPTPPINWAAETETPVATQEPLMAATFPDMVPAPSTVPTRDFVGVSPKPKKLIPTRLSAVNVMRFAAWLDTADTGKFTTYDAVGVAAGDALGIRPTTQVVRELMLEKGKKLAHRPMLNTQAVTIMARNLVRLMTKLGEAPDEELIELSKE